MIWNIVQFVLAVLICAFVIALSRAIAAKAATGKWPHEDDEALEIFKSLP